MEVDNLNTVELQRLVGWFLFYMPMDQRRRLMAQMPQVYGKLFPDVSTDAILAEVRTALDTR